MIIAISFLWVGFVCAISFMESWLKFRADGVTLEIGLSIGKLIFKALNRVEWVLCIALIVLVFTDANKLINYKNLILGFLIIVLVCQTFWVLPGLEARAELKIQNIELPPSNLHFIFVIAECLKVLGLCLYGVFNFSNSVLK